MIRIKWMNALSPSPSTRVTVNRCKLQRPPRSPTPTPVLPCILVIPMHFSLSFLPFALAAVSGIPVYNNASHHPAYKRQDAQSTIPSHIYRTRAQSAVNLGFWLVGERCKQILLCQGDDYLMSLRYQMVTLSTSNHVAPTRNTMTSLL